MEDAIPKAKQPEIQPGKSKVFDFLMQELAQEKLENITTIDLQGKTTVADYMIIATGTSSRQVVAAAKKLQDKLCEVDVNARIEGTDSGDWVIVDAGEVVLHIFRPEVREFYNLEKLWATDFSTVGYNLYTSA